MEKVIVQVNEKGTRLDSYIASKKKELSRTNVQRLIESSNILVNNNIQKISYKVQAGDEISIVIPEAKEIELKPQDIKVDIVYEDSDIIVVNKPKGLVVHPAVGNPDGTLVNAIMNICKDSLSGIGGEIRPGIVHRLDKDTTGLLIIAKNDKAHINLSEQIKNREVKKIYIALVRGIVLENEATINMPIGRSTKDRKKMAVVKNGKEAVTHFKVLNRFKNYTLLEIKIDTGRTHQIRVHTSYIGHPIIGDTAYGGGKTQFERAHAKHLDGQCLHARELSFPHPKTKEIMHFECELPDNFKALLNILENQ